MTPASVWDQLLLWLENPGIRSLVDASLLIIIIFVLVKVGQRVVGRKIEDSGTRYRVKRGISLAGYLFVGVGLASVFSDSMDRLTLVLGGVGAGVAFALQEVIASIAGWVALSLGGFFAVGDRIQLGGTRGDVIAIGVLRTTLVEMGEWVDGDLYNGRVVRVANSFVFKEPVYNYSGDFPFLWDEIKVPIRFDSDRAQARELLQSAVESVVGEGVEDARERWKTMQQNFAVEDAQIAPMVTLSFNDNYVVYTVRYVVHHRRRRITKHLVSERVLDAIDGSGGAVRLGGSTLELYAGTPFEVHGQAA